MGESERAVFELLEMGPISAAKSGLFANALGHLVAARLARRTRDGGYELTSRATGAPMARGEPTTVPPPSRGATATLTAVVPAECAEILDRMGPTREAALLAVLRRWAGSGIRRR